MHLIADLFPRSLCQWNDLIFSHPKVQWFILVKYCSDQTPTTCLFIECWCFRWPRTQESTSPDLSTAPLSWEVDWDKVKCDKWSAWELQQKFPQSHWVPYNSSLSDFKIKHRPINNKCTKTTVKVELIKVNIVAIVNIVSSVIISVLNTIPARWLQFIRLCYFYSTPSDGNNLPGDLIWD